MADLGDVRKGAGYLMAGVAYPILGILGFVLHIWTILIAYTAGGLIAAGISFVFPVLSQLYWGYEVWGTTGTFFNTYCLAIAAYAVFWIMAAIGITMADS